MDTIYFKITSKSKKTLDRPVGHYYIDNNMCAKIIDKKLKKREIAFTAMRVLGRKGPLKTSVKDIAEELKIGKGTIYEYFSSKKDIYDSAFKLIVEDFQIHLMNIQEKTDDPISRIKGLLTDILDYYISLDKELFQGLFIYQYSKIISNTPNMFDKSQELMQIKRGYISRYIQLLQSLISKAKRQKIIDEKWESEILSYTLMAQLIGFTMLNLLTVEVDLRRIYSQSLNTIIGEGDI